MEMPSGTKGRGHHGVGGSAQTRGMQNRIRSGEQDWPLWAQGSGRPPAWGSILQLRARVLDCEATVAGKAAEV